MENDKDIALLKKRLSELANKAYSQGIFTYTQFLGLSEQSVFHDMERELSFAAPCLYGGHEGADRVIIRFGSEEELGYSVEPPICCIHVTPLNARFADKLTHRDFLGALMNLGIDRATTGDILVGQAEGYIFCLEQIGEYIVENLTQIKHTNVSCRLTTDPGEVVLEEPEHMNVQAASLRIDGIIAKVYNKSRSEVLELFRTGKVFINGRLCENNSKLLVVGDTVNVRGFGKFRLCGEPRTTRKGKNAVDVDVFR